MATKGEGKILYGPLRTPPGDSLGAEEVSNVPSGKNVPDPLGYVKAK
jgi:hypothetical protein